MKMYIEQLYYLYFADPDARNLYGAGKRKRMAGTILCFLMIYAGSGVFGSQAFFRIR